MKIPGGELEPSAGTVAIDSHERVGRLRQDQFAFEDQRVLDVVLQGHAQMWAAMRERDAIYANPEAWEEDFLKAAELEAKYVEYSGYTVEARGYSRDIEWGQISRRSWSSSAPYYVSEFLVARRGVDCSSAAKYFCRLSRCPLRDARG